MEDKESPEQNKKRFTKEEFEEILKEELFKKDGKGFFQNQTQISTIRSLLGSVAESDSETGQKNLIGVLHHYYHYGRLDIKKDKNSGIVFSFFDKDIDSKVTAIHVIDVNGLKKE